MGWEKNSRFISYSRMEGNIPSQRRVIILQRQILQSNWLDCQLEDLVSTDYFLCARFVTDRGKQSGKIHMVQCKDKEVDRATADAILSDKMMSGLLKWKVSWSLLKIFVQRMWFITEIATAVFDLARKTWSRYCNFISETWEANS